MDPYRLAEGFVHSTYHDVWSLVLWLVGPQENRITFAADTVHTYVRDNYIVHNKCGEAWVFSTTTGAYQKYRFDQNRPCP